MSSPSVDVKSELVVDKQSPAYGSRVYVIVMGVDGRTYNTIDAKVVVPPEAGADGTIVGPVQAGLMARNRARAINMKTTVDRIAELGLSVDELNQHITECMVRTTHYCACNHPPDWCFVWLVTRSRAERTCACETTGEVVVLGVASVCLFPLCVYICCAMHHAVEWEQQRLVEFSRRNADLSAQKKPYRLGMTNDPQRGEHSRFVIVFAANRDGDPWDGLRVGSNSSAGGAELALKPVSPEMKN